MMLEVLTSIVGVTSTAIQSGFKPRFEKYFKKLELEPQQVRAHTERLYREVCKSLSQVFVAENQRASYAIEYMVRLENEYKQVGEIAFDRLPILEEIYAHHVKEKKKNKESQ